MSLRLVSLYRSVILVMRSPVHAPTADIETASMLSKSFSLRSDKCETARSRFDPRNRIPWEGFMWNRQFQVRPQEQDSLRGFYVKPSVPGSTPGTGFLERILCETASSSFDPRNRIPWEGFMWNRQFQVRPQEQDSLRGFYVKPPVPGSTAGAGFLEI